MKCGREITQAPARVLDRPGEPPLFQPKGYGIKDCGSHWQTWLRRAETTTSGTVLRVVRWMERKSDVMV